MKTTMKETIKANDLRIGNFVLDRGNKILTIDRFWGNKIECDIKGMPDKSESGIQVYFHPFTEDIDYLIPIPLTEEWLLKFGFEYRKEILFDGWYSKLINYNSNRKEILFDGWYSKLINYNSIRIFKDENGFFKYYSSITYIQHVHQLQNLYFALTGEELTIKEQ